MFSNKGLSRGIVHFVIVVFIFCGAQILSFLGPPHNPFFSSHYNMCPGLAALLRYAEVPAFPSAFYGAFVGLHLSFMHMQLWNMGELPPCGVNPGPPSKESVECASPAPWVDNFEVLSTFLHKGSQWDGASVAHGGDQLLVKWSRIHPCFAFLSSDSFSLGSYSCSGIISQSYLQPSSAFLEEVRHWGLDFIGLGPCKGVFWCR